MADTSQNPSDQSPGFPPIGTPAPDGQAAGESSDIDKLKADNEALNRRLTEADARDVERSRTIDRLIQGQPAAAPAPAVAPAPAEPPPEPPSPTDDPKGYSDFVAAQAAKAVLAGIAEDDAQVGQQQGRTDAINTLWSTFSARHKDLAEDTVIAKALGQDALAKIQAADPGERAVIAARDAEGFADRLADSMKTYYKDRGIAAPGDDSQSDPHPQQRTAGVGGGQTGGAGGTAGGGKGPNAPSQMQEGSFVKDLKQMQVESGFF